MALVGRLATKIKRWDDRRHAEPTDALDRDIVAAAARGKPDPALGEIVRQAWETGKTIDLANVIYGPGFKPGVFFDAPASYYFWLAGLVRSQSCRRIFEIGTHYGGSCLAMLRGLSDRDNSQIITVDITDLNLALRFTAGITKFIGDANSEAVVKRAVLAMGPKPIDLLFIDAAHQFVPTMTNLGLYVLLLRPRFVVSTTSTATTECDRCGTWSA